jgi:hypothetical protein
MLTIENFKKIKNQWFGDWQIGKVMEDTEFYAIQCVHRTNKRSITLAILREGRLDDEFFERVYPISLVEDGTHNVIEDIVYKASLEDMELFGESLKIYLDTI